MNIYEVLDKVDSFAEASRLAADGEQFALSQNTLILLKSYLNENIHRIEIARPPEEAGKVLD